MSRAFILWSLALAICVTGCGRSDEQSASNPSWLKTNRQVFQVKGLVTAVNPAEKSVTIKHEEIPGYMQPMTMPFDVRDTNELAGIQPGDPVLFRLTVSETEGWVDHLQKTGPKRNDLPTTGPFRVVRDVEPLSIGDPLPEYRFTNQLGKSFSTTDFKGSALAITFLFTRCPYPEYCPLMANNFAAVQRKLLASPGGPTNWQLLTISFDPEFDTPSVLKGYADARHFDPRHATFATGELIDITAIGDQFGLTLVRDNGAITHNLRTVVIDAAGRVQRIFIENKWTPDELAAEMVKAAAVK